MADERVLLVGLDDDVWRQRQASFERSGYRVTRLRGDAGDALQEVMHSWPDLIVMAECSASRGGAELMGYLWGIWPIPVMVLGQRPDVNSSVQYYEMGADAYLAPPVDSRELLARARNLLRLARRDRNDDVL
jgi:two-component system, OmpR family, response regulator